MTPTPQKPWADFRACPFRPQGLRGTWYVFEEIHPKPGYGRRLVHLTGWQIDRGDLSPLEFRADWLADQFPADTPASTAPEDGFDQVAVAAWIRHHVNAADNRSRPSMTEPAPDLATFDGVTNNAGDFHKVTSATVRRSPGGGAKITFVMSLAWPGGNREQIAITAALTPAMQAQAAEVLLGRRTRS